MEHSTDDTARRIALVAPADLRHRFAQLPREVVPEGWRFTLTDDQRAIRAEITRSRLDENTWPKLQYLWPLHPMVEWLTDRMLTGFGRHCAPVVVMSEGLERGESVYVISGLVPNRKSHPLVLAWLGVRFRGDGFVGIESFADTVTRTGLGRRSIPNRGQPADLAPLRARLPEAVWRARQWMIERRDAFDAELQAKLKHQLAELERLRRLQVRQLELALEHAAPIEPIRASRRQRGLSSIDEVFERYQQWVNDTLTTEREPYLQVACLLTEG